MDLKSAYKQFAIHPTERKRAVIAVKSPVDGRVYGFICSVLPFGASASVLAFNRISRLLWRVFIEAGVLCTAYFDDFPVLDLSAARQVCENLIRAVVRILGFKCSEDKEVGFSEQTEMLGVVFDTRFAQKGDIQISNKKSRIESLTANIDDLIREGKVKSSEVPRIFGRLQFAEHQIAGRVGKLAMTELRKLEDSKAGVWNLDFKAVEELKLLRYRLCEHPPRVLNFSDSRPPIQVFTDGACEPDKDGRYHATVGGVIYVDGHREFFGGSLSESLVQEWLSSKKRIIGLVELYAVLLARVHWASFLEGRKVVYYIDNMAAMQALIKGSSSDPAWRDTLRLFEEAEAKGQVSVGFQESRLPPTLLMGRQEGMHLCLPKKVLNVLYQDASIKGALSQPNRKLGGFDSCSVRCKDCTLAC